MNADLKETNADFEIKIPSDHVNVRFMNVTKVLCRRSDLLSFFGQNGKRVTVDMPWFGAELANIGKECFSRAKPEYSYYCGFADDVHFHKNNRHLARFCHMPADLDLFLDQSTPRVGNLIMVQDKRFAKLLLGQVSYTVDTLEHKLTIGKNGEANTDLVRLAKKHLGLS